MQSSTVLYLFAPSVQYTRFFLFKKVFFTAVALSLYPPLDWRESKEVAWKLKAVLEVKSLFFL
jgi:hypothetical protein